MAKKIAAPPSKPAAKPAGKPVLVTTTSRGVFFGYATDTSKDVVVLKNCRNCIYWPCENQGFLGLASMGPQKGAKIGAMAPSVELRGITSVSEVTPEAAKIWSGFPWE